MTAVMDHVWNIRNNLIISTLRALISQDDHTYCNNLSVTKAI